MLPPKRPAIDTICSARLNTTTFNSTAGASASILSLLHLLGTTKILRQQRTSSLDLGLLQSNLVLGGLHHFVFASLWGAHFQSSSRVFIESLLPLYQLGEPLVFGRSPCRIRDVSCRGPKLNLGRLWISSSGKESTFWLLLLTGCIYVGQSCARRRFACSNLFQNFSGGL